MKNELEKRVEKIEEKVFDKSFCASCYGKGCGYEKDGEQCKKVMNALYH